MALTQEDLAQIAAFMRQQEEANKPAPAPAPEPTVDRVAAPWYYVHLADGRVLETQDSASTQIDDAIVIGRYPMSEAATKAAQERQ